VGPAAFKAVEGSLTRSLVGSIPIHSRALVCVSTQVPACSFRPVSVWFLDASVGCELSASARPFNSGRCRSFKCSCTEFPATFSAVLSTRGLRSVRSWVASAGSAQGFTDGLPQVRQVLGSFGELALQRSGVQVHDEPYVGIPGEVLQGLYGHTSARQPTQTRSPPQGVEVHAARIRLIRHASGLQVESQHVRHIGDDGHVREQGGARMLACNERPQRGHGVGPKGSLSRFAVFRGVAGQPDQRFRVVEPEVRPRQRL